ncbi:hypothetical protein BMW22_41600 (plasmid) [Rhizobium leguminosarum]|uniref:Antitoxin VbhA domain-containing protein n=1 Tax=Rhizobium leguminosarum TaxID=384 RepID=A0A1L3ZQ29_RHILE|nr:hypothetical protein [Rhizobium leguminosarum]API57759.1 hypothetical protein BMW22_41600 [Rhizobium leguminosarum]
MSIEIRRKAAANAFRRAREAGRPIEIHPDFLSWIEQWIAGEIEMSEVAYRYHGLLAQRGDVRRSRTTPLTADILQDGDQDQPKQSVFDLETEIDNLVFGEHDT